MPGKLHLSAARQLIGLFELILFLNYFLQIAVPLLLLYSSPFVHVMLNATELY